MPECDTLPVVRGRVSVAKPYARIVPMMERRSRRSSYHLRARKSLAFVLLRSIALLGASCSSGPSAAERQAEATGLVHKVAVDSDAMIRAVREYKADVGNPTISKSQLRRANAAMTAAVARAAKDTRACLSLESALPRRITGNAGWDKSNCQLFPPGLPQRVEVVPSRTIPQ